MPSTLSVKSGISGGLGLLTSIVWTLIDRLDDVYINDIVYLLRCVGGYK